VLAVLAKVRSRMGDEQGAILVLMVVTMVVLLGFSAVVVDLGNARQIRRQAQNASDAAALAGAYTLQSGGTAAQARTAAESYAANNGFGTGLGVAYSPPISGPRTGDAGCVEVVSTKTVPGTFSKAIGQNQVGSSGRAVACQTTGAIGAYGIVSLNPSQCQSILVNGNEARIEMTNAGIFVNSSCSNGAMHVNGNNISIDVTGAPIDVVGDYSSNGNGITVSPAPAEGANPITDPYAALPVPTPPTSPVFSSCSGTTVDGVITFSPGRYNCQISITGNSPVVNFAAGDYHVTGGISINGNFPQVTFGAGVYTLEGSFTNNGNSSVITGNGVTFYQSAGSWSVNGNLPTTTLTPPASGPYAGITLFQSRTNTSAVTVNGNSSVSVHGVLYARAAPLIYNGNNQDFSNHFAVIVDRFTVNGNMPRFRSDHEGVVLTGVSGVALYE
jgi:hypothetical protein